MPWIECVPNISEGRRPDVVDRCVEAVAAAGVAMLDVTSDATHNRSVLTFAGESAALHAAVIALFDCAVATIDLRRHTGEHPRVGVVDVVPFVPILGATMVECVQMARAVGEAVAMRHGVPVYLYEEACPPGPRRRLEDVRRGGLQDLAGRMTDPAWLPDFGPTAPHPSAGVTVIGARLPLIAFNVNLGTDRLAIARDVARAVRQSSGGLPAVKAMGVTLADRGIVQVSMNLTDYRTTSIEQAFEAVRREAELRGVRVVESELVGLAPAAALTEPIAERVRLRDFREDRILEHQLEAARRTGLSG